MMVLQKLGCFNYMYLHLHTCKRMYQMYAQHLLFLQLSLRFLFYFSFKDVTSRLQFSISPLLPLSLFPSPPLIPIYTPLPFPFEKRENQLNTE